MENTKAIFRFVAAALCCLVVIVYGTYQCLFTPDKKAITLNNTVTNSPTPNTQFVDITVPNNSATQTAPDNTDATASTPVSATGNVAGAVIERFISPYTANTSYNNVYLKNNTDLNIDLKEFVNGTLGYSIEKNGEPQVLILHTHATESFLMHDEEYYTDSDATRTTDNEYNMVALGKIISDNLNSAGIVTLHDTTAHDSPSYNESYSRAADTICSYLNKYPSIKVVIDLHRDSIAANDTDKVKVTTEIDGKKAAQIMLVMGSQSGSVKNHPNWKENLKLAVKIQQTTEVMYPTLARSIHFMSKNYNQSLSTGSVLIEIGTDGNTFDEAKYSAQLLSNALICLFNTL